MADLKSIWKDSPVSTPDLAGDLATARGGDPDVPLAGSSGLDKMWDDAPVSDPQGRETANSMSGLPLLPAEFTPSPEKPPEPPSLQDRSPGTIDQQ